MQISLLMLLVVIAVAMGGAVVLLARWRPERIALLLAAVVVVLGLGAAGVRVVEGIDERKVDFQGKLSVKEIRDTFTPPADRVDDPHVGYLSGAHGEMTKPDASSRVLALWSVQQLAPWLLGALILLLVFPILRRAERSEPFWEGAARRLTAVGLLLLLAIPAIVAERFIAGEAASGGNFVSPGVSPSLSITLAHFLPGVLVLALVGIFRRGVELSDLERHTV